MASEQTVVSEAAREALASYYRDGGAHPLFVGRIISGDVDSDPHMQMLARFERDITTRLSGGVVEDHLRHVIDRDRYVVATALGEVRKALYGHLWLLEGRGPYEWDDDRYREEFTEWVQNIERVTGLLAKLAWDKSDCTTDPDKVNAAKLAAKEYTVLVQPGHRSMLPSDIGLPCPTCAATLQPNGEAEKLREAVEIIRLWMDYGGANGTYDARKYLEAKERAGQFLVTVDAHLSPKGSGE